MPCVAIDAQIHAPLLHGGVPEDIRSPHIAVEAPTAVASPRPVHRIESREVDVCTALLDLGRCRRDKSLRLVAIVTGSGHPLEARTGPVLEVGRIGRAPHSTENIVALRG